jgi:hypothetical protein
LVAGLAWGNNIAKILTDTVPVFVTACNPLLLSREEALRGFSYRRLQSFIIFYCVIMVTVGFVAVSAGRLSVVSLGGSGGGPICLTILLVWLIQKPQVTVFDLIVLSLIIAPTIPNTNRTTLAVFGIVALASLLPRVIASGKQLYFIALFVIGLGIAFPLFVPPDSPLMRRIDGLIEKVTEEKEERSGSLYEREAEWAAINQKLRALGPNAQLFGYGAGGTYFVEFTGGVVPENYSHAHFSWSLFRLRYGDVGFVYLGLFALFIVANGVKMARRRGPLSRIILILDVWAFVYLFTYVVFNFLAAGLQFADLGPEGAFQSPRRNGLRSSDDRESKGSIHDR